MEDILASIRRIIADDQSRHGVAPAPAGRPSTPGAAAAPAVGPEPRREAGAPAPAARIDPVLPSRPLAPSLRPSLPDPGAGKSAAPVPHLSPPPADLAVRRLDQAVIDEIAVAGVAAALRASGPLPSALAEPAVALPPPAAEAPAAPPQPAPEVVIAPPPDVATRAAPAIDIAEPRPAASASAASVAAAPEETSTPRADAKAADADPLLSPEAGATVETSFNALATSIFVQNAGLNEGLVRDMLRPMLKSWLDDNLPAIVERLVRIEIERVARGGRA